jgi:hypothetical protein
MGDKALEDVHACGKVSQLLDLYSCGGKNRRKEVCRIGVCYLIVLSVLGDSVV